MHALIVLGLLGLLWPGPIQLQPPAGYRFPNEKDISDGWRESKPPIHLMADFNGDGIQDHAWMLLRQQRPGWGVFVFLGSKNKEPRILTLEEYKGEERAQMYGIYLASPSKTMWKTACGKGYFECEPGEPEEIKISLPSIEFCLIESGCNLFMWDRDSRSFRRFRMSD